MNPALEDTTTTDRIRLVGVLTFVVAVGMPIAAILSADLREVEVQPGLIDWIFVSAIALITIVTFGALTFWLSRKPHARTGGVGLAFAIMAFLATPVAFWTMLPVIWGTAGAWLGYRAVQRNKVEGLPSKAAVTAVVLGALAALVSVAMYVATS